jgi:hypothetical protein
MASINYAFKEISCKIVYYGPGLCGKTTNLQSIHDNVPPKFRGDLVSLATEQDRTLFFDFLPLDLGEVRGFKTKFQLYTVPGQVYYNATRRLVLRGVDGIVFVADSAPDRMEENRDSITNLRENLESYGLNLDELPWVIQYNKRDLSNAMPCDEMEPVLNPDRVPSFEAVATQTTGVKETLKGIATLVLKRLREMAEASPAASALDRRIAAANDISAVRSQKVSLSSGVPGGKPLEASVATEPPGGAPPRSGNGYTEPPIERPSAASRPAKAPARAPAGPPGLHVLQKCDLLWRGMRMGTAVVEISKRANMDNRAPFAMTCQTICFGIRRSWNQLLQLNGEEGKVIDFKTVPFYALEATAGNGVKRRGLRVWVKNAFDKACYVSYSGFGGIIQLVPAGRGWIE